MKCSCKTCGRLDDSIVPALDRIKSVKYRHTIKWCTDCKKLKFFVVDQQRNNNIVSKIINE